MRFAVEVSASAIAMRNVTGHLCKGFAVALGLVAANHARLALGAETPLRHAIFAVLDVLAAALVLLRPRRALLPIAGLFAQQLTSHGRDLVASVSGPGRIDYASLAVLLFFVALLATLFAHRRRGAG